MVITTRQTTSCVATICLDRLARLPVCFTPHREYSYTLHNTQSIHILYTTHRVSYTLHHTQIIKHTLHHTQSIQDTLYHTQSITHFIPHTWTLYTLHHTQIIHTLFTTHRVYTTHRVFIYLTPQTDYLCTLHHAQSINTLYTTHKVYITLYTTHRVLNTLYTTHRVFNILHTTNRVFNTLYTINGVFNNIYTAHILVFNTQKHSHKSLYCERPLSISQCTIYAAVKIITAKHINNSLNLTPEVNKSNCFSVQLGISILWNSITILNVMNKNSKFFLNFYLMMFFFENLIWLVWGGGVNIFLLVKLIILWLYTKTHTSIVTWCGQKVCSGWWVLRPILVFSFGQAEQ